MTDFFVGKYFGYHKVVLAEKKVLGLFVLLMNTSL